jgi:ribosomal protein S18 acetylase RimI-like enzyme
VELCSFADINVGMKRTSDITAIYGPDSLQAQQANLRAYWLGWGSWDRDDADQPMYHSGLRHPLLNGVLRIRGRSAAEVRRRFTGVPFVWWVGADSDPGLTEELIGLGVVREARLPAMAIELAKVEPVESDPDLEIGTVTSRADLIDYAAVCAEAFAIPDDQVSGFTNAEGFDRSAFSENVRFVARIDGQPVATSALSISHGVAGIYWVATREAFRGRGIGRALTTVALLAGRERGLNIGSLQASSLGEPVYRRIGFTTVGYYDHLRVPEDPTEAH